MKKGQQCSAGCECTNCSNTASHMHASAESATDLAMEDINFRTSCLEMNLRLMLTLVNMTVT